MKIYDLILISIFIVEAFLFRLSIITFFIIISGRRSFNVVFFSSCPYRFAFLNVQIKIRGRKNSSDIFCIESNSEFLIALIYRHYLFQEKLTRENKIEFNIEEYNLRSGVYFYKLKTGEDELSRKMIYLK